MMIERQVSIALAGIGVAVVLPEFMNMRHHAEYVPGSALLIGTLVGALGALFGTAVAASYDSWGRWIRMAIWIAVAAGFSFVDLVGGLRQPGAGWQIGFAVAGLAAVAGPAAVVRRLWLDSRR